VPDAIFVSFDAVTTLGVVVLHETLAQVVQLFGREEGGAVAEDHGRVLPLQLRAPLARSARALQEERHAALHVVHLDLDIALHVVDRVAGCLLAKVRRGCRCRSCRWSLSLYLSRCRSYGQVALLDLNVALHVVDRVAGQLPSYVHADGATDSMTCQTLSLSGVVALLVLDRAILDRDEAGAVAEDHGPADARMRRSEGGAGGRERRANMLRR
jgi:hypothetical protein